MTEWFVELQASEKDIHFLMHSLSASDISIFGEGGANFLRAPRLLTSTNHIEAKEAAVGLLEILNGGAKLLMPSYEGALLKSISFRNEKGEMSHHYFLTAESSDYLLHADGQNALHIADFVQLTSIDPAVAKALTLYGSLAHNWKNLYMVIEVVEEDHGGEAAMITAYPEPKYRLKDFKRTANNFESIGREARHAKHFEPPSKPMELREACELIRQVLADWIESKIIRKRS